MILPLLKKLRITHRSPASTTTNSGFSILRRFADAPRRPHWVMGLTLAAGSVWGISNLQAAHQQLLDGPPAAPIAVSTSNAYRQPAARPAMVPRDQYAAALQAQMQRVQREQGAPQGFAEQAVAKQLAYLEDTAENRYTKQQTRLSQVTRATTRRPQSSQPILSPPVHVAPTAYSSPPPVAPANQRSAGGLRQPTEMRSVASRSVPDHQDRTEGTQPEFTRQQNRNLQDRIESLLTARRLAAAGREAVRSETQPLYQPENRQIPARTTNHHSAVANALVELEARSNPSFNSQHETPVAPVSLNQPLPTQSVVSGPRPLQVPDYDSNPPVEPPRLTAPQANSNYLQERSTPARSISVLSRKLQDQDTSGNDFVLPPTGVRPPQSEPQTQDLPVQDNDLRPPSEVGDQDSVEQRLNEIDRRLQDGNQRQGPDESADDFVGSQDDLRERDKDSLLTCDEYRTKLLGQSIRDIALDVSPPASEIRDQYVAISRGWTDRLGNVVATGTMVDLRRGYVIIDAAKGRVKIPYGKLSDADWAAIAEYWQIPDLCGVGGTAPPMRSWVPQTYTWKASALCHKPLYFENVQLERYGHSHGPILQPIHSTAHFFVRLFALPYQTGIHPPNECMYALGYYRPGNCAPWLKDPIPFSRAGLRRQALVITGLSFIP